MSKNKKNKLKEEKKEKKFNPIIGVYAIHNIKNNKYYIGSSTNVAVRLRTHKQHLKKGCHNCRILQKDFDSLTEENFEFIIIESNIKKHLLTAYEKYYIYIYDAIVKYKGYNEIFPTTNHTLFKEVCNLKLSNKDEQLLNHIKSKAI